MMKSYFKMLSKFCLEIVAFDGIPANDHREGKLQRLRKAAADLEVMNVLEGGGLRRGLGGGAGLAAHRA